MIHQSNYTQLQLYFFPKLISDLIENKLKIGIALKCFLKKIFMKFNWIKKIF